MLLLLGMLSRTVPGWDCDSEDAAAAGGDSTSGIAAAIIVDCFYGRIALAGGETIIVLIVL